MRVTRSHRGRMALRIAFGVAAIVLGLTHSNSAGAATLSGGPAAGRVLGGLNAQGLPVVAGVTRNAKRMTLVTTFVMNCSSGDQPIFPDSWAKMPIAANGSVRGHVTLTAIPSTALTGGSDSISGKLNRKAGTFSGVWDLHLDFSSNGQTDSCDSGRVAFRTRL